MKRINLMAGLMVFAIFLLFLPISAKATQYGIIDLGQPNGSPNVRDINDSGFAVGDGNKSTAFMLNVSTGEYSYFDKGVWQKSFAYGINNSGQVAGFVTPDINTAHACFWSNVNANIIDIHPPGWSESRAYAINNNGIVVGNGDDENSKRKGFLWNSNTNSYTFIDDSSWWNVVSPRSINDSNQLTGKGTGISSTRSIPIFVDASQNISSIYPPGWSRGAWGQRISNSGLIIITGETPTSLTYVSVVWDSNTNSFGSNISTPDSKHQHGFFAYDINDSGLVVGKSDLDAQCRAFVYDSNTETFTDITPNGWWGVIASAINKNGQIVGSGNTYRTGPEHVFFAYPDIPPTANAGSDQTVDEKSTVTLDGSGSSDPDDGISLYLWTQTGGTTVTLSNANAVKPTFTSPAVTSIGETLTFQLTVTDKGSLKSTDTCDVNVNWIPTTTTTTTSTTTSTTTTTTTTSATTTSTTTTSGTTTTPTSTTISTTTTTLPSAPTMSIGSSSGESGGWITLPIEIANQSSALVAAASVDIGYDASVFMNPSAAIGPAGEAVKKEVATSDIASGLFRISILSGSNNDVMGDGVIAYLTLKVQSKAPIGLTTLTATASGSDATGGDVIVNGSNGTVTIIGDIPGDCNGDGTVSVAEVQSAINMFLGINTIEGCVDVNGNGKVSIGEVQKIINKHLRLSVSSSTSGFDSPGDSLAKSSNSSTVYILIFRI